jgi:MipA family protein
MYLIRTLLVAGGVLIAGVGHAMGPQVDIIPNYIGVGLGTTTEWMGSKDNVVGIVPGARMQLSGNRFLEVYGATGDINVLDVPNWEFGPMVSYRFGRKDVQDPVVNTLPPIDGGFEAGAFVGWHYVKMDGIPWRLRLGIGATTGVSGGATGSHVSPYASIWVPLSHKVFVGLGGGVTWSSTDFMQQRFGVTPAASAASGLPVYSAEAGIRQVYAWPAVVFVLSPEWYAGVGGFYQRLTGDAAASPIVTQRGDRNQWTFGAGMGWSWK